jgi:SAM-dependent methyltransferase
MKGSAGRIRRKNMKKALSSLLACGSFVLAAIGLPAQDSRIAPENANEARLNKLQPPGQVMDIIGAAAGMTIAEIGAGQGRYVVHLADRVGPEGKIYAEDIDGDALRHLAERCRRVGFANVETVLGDPADPKLPAGKLDLIFVISSYHHFGDPVALMSKARPALKPTGRLAIAEWVPEKDGQGGGTPPEKMRAQMESAGYSLERIDRSLEANSLNIYVFRPVSR